MKENKKCRSCGGKMKEGYVPDFTHGTGAATQGIWVDGSPKDRTLLGLKTGGIVPPGIGKSIVSFRCVKCGLLEFYAN